MRNVKKRSDLKIKKDEEKLVLMLHRRLALPRAAFELLASAVAAQRLLPCNSMWHTHTLTQARAHTHKRQQWSAL